MNKKELNLMYEGLVKLYLRLKGFWVSNLIIHSPTSGKESGEIDIIGVRFPFHRQEDRKVFCTDFLECSIDRIEIIIAEVKNVKKKEDLKFNKGIRSKRESIEKLINWIGCFNEIDSTLISMFEENLNIHRNKELNGFSGFPYDNEIGQFQFKFVFFCPSLEPWKNNGMKYVSAIELLDFIWECLNTNTDIPSCSRTYNFELWNEHQKLVKFFKTQDQRVTKKTFEEWIINSKK